MDEFREPEEIDPFGRIAEQEAADIDDEQSRLGTPTHTALLQRHEPTHVETMWIHAFRDAALVVVTCPPMRIQTLDQPVSLPGVVRSIPAGPRDVASDLAFRRKHERIVQTYVNDGWVERSDITVRTDKEES